MPEVLLSDGNNNSPLGQSIVKGDRFQQIIDSELNRGVDDFINSVDEQNWIARACKLTEQCWKIGRYLQDVGMRSPSFGLDSGYPSIPAQGHLAGILQPVPSAMRIFPCPVRHQSR